MFSDSKGRPQGPGLSEAIYKYIWASKENNFLVHNNYI